MTPTDYKSAGVNIDSGEELVSRIKGAVRETFGPEVVTDLGLFGGAFRLDTSGYADPVLIASTDGVGTKTKVAEWAGRHDTIGHDLVNHCVNDIFTCGARPLFFLDYYATARLDVEVAESVIRGLAKACRIAGVALLGGETAEMPAVYHEGVYDLAGTIVGVADRAKLIDGRTIREGDLLVGLLSSGLHTNGYTLARKVLLEDGGLRPDDCLDGVEGTIADALLAPHVCYEPIVRPWIGEGFAVKGMAHITGGGIEGNVRRIIPEGLRAKIEWSAWEMPALFRHIMERGHVPEDDMRRTFNLGIGWVMIMDPANSDELFELAACSGVRAVSMGKVVRAG